MTKRRPLLLVAILVVLLIIAFFVLFAFKQESQVSTPAESVASVEFIDEVGIGNISFDPNAFMVFVEKFEVSRSGINDWRDLAQKAKSGDYNIVNPEKIIVKLVNDEQKFYKLKGPLSDGGDIITLFSIGQDFDERSSVLGINIQVSKLLVSQLKGREEDLAGELNIQAVLGLYKMSVYGAQQDAARSEESITISARDFIIVLIRDEQPVFQSRGILGRLSSVLGEFQLVKPSYAQCVGTVICGTIVNILKCTKTGSAADCIGKSQGDFCAVDIYGSGTCQYDSVCDYGDFTDLDCPIRTSYNTCEGASGSCPNPPYDCTDPNYQSSCTWTGPIPTPTPTPEPPPPPTPTPTPIPACTAPAGLGGGASCDGGDGLIDITWTWAAVPGALEYLFNVDNNSDFSSPELSIFTGSTNYTTVNLASGTWYARVRVNSSATCSAPSAWSATASVTNNCAACAAPVNNAPVSACVSQTTYNVTWRFNQSAGANQYQLVVSTCSGAGFFGCVVYDSGWQSSAFFSCAGGSCSSAMTGLTSGTTYYDLVRARGLSCPQSAWSSQQSAFRNCFVACAAPGSSSGSGTCDVGDGLLDINWTWGVVTGATSYRLQVDDDPAFGSPVFNGTTASTSRATNNLTPGVWYARVRVETDNGIACTAPSTWSASFSYTNPCLASVQGTSYDDPFGDATINMGTGLCEFPGAPPATAANSGTVTIDNDLGVAWTGTVGGLGTYSVNNVPIATNRYDATFTPSGTWVCMCPAPDPGNPGSCFPYANTIDAPMTGVNFFVSTVRDSWFQTVGGDVHAFGTIKSLIPDTCVASPTCTPEFSLPGTDDVGVVSSQVGPGNYGTGGGTVSSPGWEATSTYQGPTYLFDFWRRESDPPTPLADLNNRPSPPEGIYEINSSTDLTLSGNWSNIPGAGPLTIFVNFDSPTRTLTLNPNPPGITLDPGSPQALLTIITNGNVRVADTVTRIEGVFLIDGVFRSCVTTDCGYDDATGTAYQLNMRGSVIAWGGVDLQRDLFLENRDTPAELFTYEPEFVQRLPEFILRAIYTWKEVAP